MNKFLVACLESQFHAFDARTQHVKKGFASVTEKLTHGATVWGAWCVLRLALPNARC